MSNLLAFPPLKELIAVLSALLIVFLFVLLIERIVHKSFANALSSLVKAFKLEIKTDSGKVNLIGMMALIFLYLFTAVHRIMAELLSTVRPVTTEHETSITTVQLALFFGFSLVVVGWLEHQSRTMSDPPKGSTKQRPRKFVQRLETPSSSAPVADVAGASNKNPA